MEAKDTAMNHIEAKKFGWVKAEFEDTPDGVVCNEIYNLETILEVQAEISWKAAYKYALEGAVMEGAFDSIKKLGIKEVVEWIESNNYNDITIDISLTKWQAKLKEWRINP